MTTTAPAYYQLSSQEMQLLAKSKASGCTTLVYITISGFAYGGRVACWPSIDTIWKTLGKTISKRSIVRCMKTLEEIGLIKRKGSQRGKIRLLAKRASAFVDALVKSATSDHASLQASDSVGLQKLRTKKTTKLSKRRFRSRSQRGRRMRSKHHESQVSRDDTQTIERVCAGWLNDLYEHQRLTHNEVNLLSSHRARSTDEWRHYERHLPGFVKWVNLHV
jgi:hypothetical protein